MSVYCGVSVSCVAKCYRMHIYTHICETDLWNVVCAYGDGGDRVGVVDFHLFWLPRICQSHCVYIYIYTKYAIINNNKILWCSGIFFFGSLHMSGICVLLNDKSILLDLLRYVKAIEIRNMWAFQNCSLYVLR